MSITSTRRVSTSLAYSQRAGGYDAGSGGQSFVENIDTSNNVSVNNEENRGRSGYAQARADSQPEESYLVSEPVSNVAENGVSGAVLQPSVSVEAMIDNDDDNASVYQNKSVNIYGANQAISAPEEEAVDNPYLRYFYENNEVIEDVDEFV